MGDCNKCFMCDKQFLYRKTLYSHIRKRHKVEPHTEGKIKCPKEDCSFSFSVLRCLRSHVQEKHKVTIVTQNTVFPSVDDFFMWKSEEEKTSRSFFVSPSGAKSMKCGTKTTYVCHRSGIYTSSSKGKRMLKSKGSIKMGGHCTAGIELIQDRSGTCTVIYFRTHFGHELNISFLPLSIYEKDVIAGKIAEGVPFERILYEMRESARTGAVSERLRLLTRKDLNNIAREYGITVVRPPVVRKGRRGKPVGMQKEPRYNEGDRKLKEIEEDVGDDEKEDDEMDRVSECAPAEQEENNSAEEDCVILSPIVKQNNHNERVAQLRAKLQILESRINSCKLSKETLDILGKGLDRMLSLTDSDFGMGVEDCTPSENECLLRISDKGQVIIEKLTLAEESTVASALRQLNCEVSNVDVDSDHSYCKY